MKRKSMLFVIALCALLPPAGRAGLVSTVNTDTVTNVVVEWRWNPETSDTNAPSLSNWSVSLSVVSNNANWDVTLQVRHMVNPHSGETLPSLSTKSYSFANTNFGVVISDKFSVTHPGPDNHVDEYEFVFDRSMSPANTLITLTGEHAIPEPGSLALIGIFGCAAFFLRRLQMR